MSAAVFSVGELVSFKWQLGVAVQSNHCEGLSSPFIRVEVQVQDTNQHMSTHSFDLSLFEFKVNKTKAFTIIF